MLQRLTLIPLVLCALSSGEHVAQVARAETAKGLLATVVRSQGLACNNPQRASRDAKLSKPDYDVWVLTCENAIYRIGRYPDLPPKVEKLQ
jgi:hypothetical protein